jgi:hypothetical protein
MAKKNAEEQDKQLAAGSPDVPAPEGTADLEGLTVAHPTTDTNVWLQVVGSVVCTLITCYALYFWGRGAPSGSWPAYLHGLVNQRGPIQWLELLCFYVIVFFIFQKNTILRKQIRHIVDDPPRSAASTWRARKKSRISASASRKAAATRPACC